MKGKRNVWAVFLGIAVAAMSAAGCGAGESSGQGPEKVSEEKRLTVYTSHKQEVYAPIIKEFEERTGIWVEVVPGGTTELLERIREEGEKGSCDVMFGGGVESYEAPEGKTSETVSGASAPTAERTDANTQTSDVKELAGFRRKKIPLPDFERTFFAPADCRNRSAIYISAATKYKVSAILHLLGMRIQGLQLWSTICCAL